MDGRIKVLDLDRKTFVDQYRDSPEVYDILLKHIFRSSYYASQDLMYLEIFNCYLTYNTKSRFLSIHLFDEAGDDEYVMILKTENFSEVVIV